MATAKKATKTAAQQKPTRPRKPLVPAPDVVPPRTGSAPQAVEKGNRVNTNSLVDAICARTGQKRKDVKPVVEAMLKELGETLLRGDQLNLPPMGKIIVKREKEVGSAHVLNCKIRINRPD